VGTAGTQSRIATAEHWFDFTCPFCYIAQDRNRVLRAHGIQVAEHAIQIHPEIGPGGVVVGPRSGPAYDFLASEAEAAGLPLQWTDRIAYSRPALGVAEWIGHTHPEASERFSASVFHAYFGEGMDIESPDLLVALGEQAGVDIHPALRSAADEALTRSEALAHAHGVTGTPTWIAGAQRVSGLRTREWFADWAESLQN
jgi:predicted DsbA family dithiol-disulfide isomerase